MSEMTDRTDNHDYATPDHGVENWHEPLNENFENLDIDVEIRDVANNRGEYDPRDGAKYLELDTGIVYIGDGEEWSPAMAMAYYNDSGELNCGELASCGDAAENDGGNGSDADLSTFGVNARSVHDGAIVFGDATQRQIWSKNPNEIRTQMPIHAPVFEAGESTVDEGGVTTDSLEAESVITSELEADALTVEDDRLTVEMGGDSPHLDIEGDAVSFSIDSETPQLSIEAEDVIASVPIHAPSFETNSSSAVKTNVETVDPARALDGVRALEINTWQFERGDDASHIGPMAEDFAETFDVGASDESIATVDADGVALAAIQGLADRLEAENADLRDRLREKDERLDALEGENEEMRTRLSEIEASLSNTAADDD